MLEKCIKLINKSNNEELKKLLGFDDAEDDGVSIVNSNLGQLINSPSKKGIIPLHLACKNQDMQILEVLMRCKELDVDKRDPANSFTPMITLINYGGNIECINVLLKRKPNLELCDNEFGDSPLHWSVRLELPIVVHRLVKYGMNINAPNKYLKYTPLQLAVICGSEEVVSELMSLSADPLILLNNEEEYSILHLCILNNMPNTALYILKTANESQKEKLLNSVDRNGNNALHFASINGMLGLVNSLINEGFNQDIKNGQNRTYKDLIDEYSTNNINKKITHNNGEIRERKAKINRDYDDLIYETEVSKFFLKHKIAEKGYYSESNNRRVMGKHEFVFKLFFKKGYFDFDPKFTSLTNQDLATIGIKDDELKNKILTFIKEDLKVEKQIVDENTELKKSYEKKTVIVNIFTAISTCILLFFIIYVSLNAFINSSPS
ncbi:hypothetical protein FG386_001160 [Cryptosporidium ryanae]|uniref:uncharacterized protein n=1 Tax=Cryptosporidium ryanae TaxID=515981 RepID=UPI003519EF8B|nr:hypothetical protein FG386_001160 [Cryptosporidium ryanae]